MKVSLCMIVKNEENNIAACIDSFNKICAEIIVVDTGSTDNTIEIAKELGAKVINHEWGNDFSEARNVALDNVTSEWVMMVDADYRITEKDIQEVRKLNPDEYDVIYINRVFMGKSHSKATIWRNSCNLRFVLPVHEYLDFDHSNVRILHLNVGIQELPSSLSFKESRAKYVEIMISYIDRNPNDLRILYYLVSDCRFLERYQESISWGEEYMKSSPYDKAEINRIFVYMSDCYKNLGDLESAKESLLLAVLADPKNIDPFLELGYFAKDEGRLDDAIQWFKIADTCEYDSKSSFFEDKRKYEYQAKKELAKCLFKSGEFDSAKNYCESILKESNDKEISDLLNKIQNV